MKKCDCVEGENFYIRNNGNEVSFFGFEVFRGDENDLLTDLGKNEVTIFPESGFTDIIEQAMKEIKELVEERGGEDSEGVFLLSPVAAICLFFGGIITIGSLEGCSKICHSEESDPIVVTLTFDDFVHIGFIHDGTGIPGFPV